MSQAPEVNPQKMQKAEGFFKHGNEALGKNSLDYAIQMYREACRLVPGHLMYRQALRLTQRKKFDNEAAKVGRLVGMRVQPIRLKLKALKAKGSWASVLDGCEDAFVLNPWDVGTAGDAAEACEHLDYPDMAQWLMESVLPQAGESADFFRHLAQVYELNQNWQRAIACWEKVKKLAPSDENAGRKINSLSASASIARSGLQEVVGRKTPSHTAPAPTETDQEEEEEGEGEDAAEDLQQSQLTPEQRWLKEIEKQPQLLRAYLELADHYKGQNRLDDAEKVLARGLKAIPGDPILQTAHAETQIARLHKAIDAWTKRARTHPEDVSAPEKVKQLTAMLNDYEIKEYRRRLSLRPDDPNLNLQLGQRLARVGQHDEAIAQFQQARNDPALRVQALMLAGQSFEANGVLKLAERSYQDALKGADPADSSLLNTLNYRLGRVSELQGNLKDAESYYNEVAANDYSYEDVAQRLRNLSEGPRG